MNPPQSCLFVSESSQSFNKSVTDQSVMTDQLGNMISSASAQIETVGGNNVRFLYRFPYRIVC